ncbi:unnamed protein product [Linum tenue]|uniref:Apyrase n=1 Tax=Linum tenue TaxID=586396 RepID=A0AAV0IZG0_9ROSI|nr:unnamed protein product [Linum tenue]
MRLLRLRNRVASKSVDSDTTHNGMDPVKFQQRVGPAASRSAPNFAYYPISRPSKRSKSNLIVFGFVLTLIALISCYYLFRTGKVVDWNKKYGIVIDGGSTGTRLHVFAYRVQGGKTVFDFGEEAAMRVSPGLSAYAEDPESAGSSLNELLEFGKERVPRGLWGDTKIRLMATAGMRLLDFDVQHRILESCRRVLRQSRFVFKDEWASVINGSDEGVYAWIVANYASGTLGADPLKTTGIIELGGASAQW